MMKGRRPGYRGHIVTCSEIERGYLYFTTNPEILGDLRVNSFNCIFLGTRLSNCRLTRGRFIPGRHLFRQKNIEVGDVLTMSIDKSGDLVVDRSNVS